MINDQYIAYERNDQWWVTIDGQRRGLFSSRDESIAHAVGAAKANERAGVRSEVSWDDPDDGVPTVYRSDGV